LHEPEIPNDSFLPLALRCGPRKDTVPRQERKMNGKIRPDDLCSCGSGKKRKDCCGAEEGTVVNLRPKDIKCLEWTPGLSEALARSLDASYLEYWSAVCLGKGKQEIRRRIAAIAEEKRYLTRVLDSLDGAFADFDTHTAMLDLPHMRERKPEAIKRYLEFRLKQFKLLVDAVDDYLEKNPAATGGPA
jgi:hypothetical protein